MRFFCFGLAVASVTLAGCNPFFLFHCSPYGCAKAEDGRTRLQPVVDAIVAYSNAEGAYPDSVAVLVPSYLRELPDQPEWAGHEEWWSYERTDSGFTVDFRYFGPGVNWCFWNSSNAKWQCGGYY